MKIDMKREIPAYTAKRGVYEVVDVPSLRYLAIDGHGDPNTSDSYRDAVATLFTVAYKLKFLSKRELDRDYVVMPLEALWWSDDMTAFTTQRDKSEWSWTALNLVPPWVTSDLFGRGCEAADDAPAIEGLRLDEISEGRCVQTLHVGPYEDEGPVLDELHREFIPGAGLRMTGVHHEIYLNDSRRTDPAKLRTILRQPVTKA